VNESLFPLPGVGDEEWRQELDFLQTSFEMLRRAVSESTPDRLHETSPFKFYKREWSFVNHVYGVAFHNVYHAAQIVSLRKRQQTWSDLT
jgi:hypothetical protein